MIEYHKNNGSYGDLIISQSALNQLDPLLGGHPSKFLRYFTEERVSTPSMELGTLFHDWQEHPDKFVVLTLDKPTGQMEIFSEKFNDLYFLEGYKNDVVFTEYCKNSLILDIDDSFKINDIFTSFHGKKSTTEEFLLLGNCIFYARREAQVDKRLKNNTILDKFQSECMAYLRFLKDKGNRIALTKHDKEVLDGCQSSYLNHPTVKALLALSGIKEEEFFWEERFEDITFKRKAKIDYYHIDYEMKLITITDTKTFSKPISLFPELSFNKYNLGRQLYSYIEPLIDKLKIESPYEWQVRLINIVVQTTDNYPCSVYECTWITMQEARKSLHNIKERLAFHIKSGNWDLTMEEQKNGVIYV